MTELDNRFNIVKPRFQFELLLPQKLDQLSDQEIDEIKCELGEDYNNSSDIHSEVERWVEKWSSIPLIERPENALDVLKEANQALFPNIHTCMKLLLVLPVTTATAERSFSTMRLLKSYLRSTMTNDRFSSLALMYINRDFNFDNTALIKKWCAQKPRRLDVAYDFK